MKLLWIDDNLFTYLTEKRTALYMEDTIEPHFARDASEALDVLRSNTFDVVLVDLRLPPGPDDVWEEYKAKDFRKYGLKLLEKVKHNGDFPHLETTKFGVFTNDAFSENKEEIQALGISLDNYKMKKDAYYEEDFIAFIWRIFHS